MRLKMMTTMGARKAVTAPALTHHQVQHDVHLAHTEVLNGALVHRLLEVRVEQQDLRTPTTKTTTGR